MVSRRTLLAAGGAAAGGVVLSGCGVAGSAMRAAGVRTRLRVVAVGFAGQTAKGLVAALVACGQAWSTSGRAFAEVDVSAANAQAYDATADAFADAVHRLEAPLAAPAAA